MMKWFAKKTAKKTIPRSEGQACFHNNLFAAGVWPFTLALVIICSVCFIPAASVYAQSPAPIKVVLDGAEMQFDVQPMLINDRTMLPIRVIAEALGATILYDASDHIATVIKGIDVIKMMVGYEYMAVNDVRIEMDVEPVEVNGRMLAPARFLSEALGCDVKWDELNNTVLITSGIHDPPYEILEKLLKNRAKIVHLGHIAQYNDQIYASEYLCLPGWIPVKCNLFTGAFALLNGRIYRTDGNAIDFKYTNMYSTSLDGNDEVFIDIVQNWGVWTYIIGDKIVYTILDTDGEEMIGLRIFDTNTSGKIDLPIYGDVISFDDEYLYIMVNKAAPDEEAIIEYWRAKWDGSSIELADDLNGINPSYFYPHSTSSDGEELYFPDRQYIAYGSYPGFYYYGYNGILIVAIDELKNADYLMLAVNFNMEINDEMFFYDEKVYFIMGSRIYKQNLNDLITLKVCDIHPDIDMDIVKYIGVIDGYIYMQGYVGYEDGPLTALFRVPVDGGTMERTEKTWSE